LEVSSPTFTYLNIYSGSRGSAYHFDLYRLKGAAQFKALGFDDYFKGEGLTCIEWAEKVAEILPPEAIRIRFSHMGDDKRQIEIVQP
jgi:tRNA threonylcarbamoyladenosine biosynthesis protein TsaE